MHSRNRTSPQRADRGPRCKQVTARAGAAIQTPFCGRFGFSLPLADAGGSVNASGSSGVVLSHGCKGVIRSLLQHPARGVTAFAFALALTPFCAGGTFAVLGPQAGSWPSILSSAGHFSAPVSSAEIFVASPGAPASVDWKSKVEKGAALILEGSSPLAASFGYRAQTETISVVHLVDIHNPALPIIWRRLSKFPATMFPPERASSRKIAGQPRRWLQASGSVQARCCGSRHLPARTAMSAFLT